MNRLHHVTLALAAAGCLVAWSAHGEMKDIAHPYILWTKEEAAALKQRIDTDATAKAQFERMGRADGGGGGGNPTTYNLFKYSVMGDAKAGEVEKANLLRFFGSRPPESVRGNPNTGNAPYRDDRTMDALRYDVLYNDLTDEQRKAFMDTVGNYLEWFRTKYGPWRRCPRQGVPRTGWLPNMQYPTVAGIHVLAAASKDEKVIKEVFESPGGFKWWLDVYLADGGFYMEEFAKYGSPVWAQLLWCEALERLGLPQYGYGCTGQPQGKPGYAGGATMRGYLGSLARAAYPRVLRGKDMPDYPCVNMGDAGSQAVVRGVNADGTGGSAWWGGPTMWGQPKMMHPMWWEYGCRRFPEDGYDYFLAQMRGPSEDVYLPSLYCGLGPIDPRKVKPPAARSYAAPERGFALLRAEESPAYWESPRPAVGMQFGMYYVHYVHDCFSILQYVANNRFVYDKMGSIWPGYAGGDPLRDSTRGQGGGVTVDSLQITPVDTGDEGCRNQRIRERQAPGAKYVAVRAKPQTVERRQGTNAIQKVDVALYPGVDAERALFLTADYLFDAFRLVSDRDRVYDWHVQGWGRLEGGQQAPWAASADLAEGKFWAPNMTSARGRKAPDPQNVRRKDAGDAAWAETIVQAGEGDAAAGVRVSMLPDKGTALYAYTVPGASPSNAVSLMARRTAPAALFAALHEPFTGGPNGCRIARFERIAQTDQGIAVAVVGKDGSGIDDRILLRYGDDADKPLTLQGNGEAFTFSDSVYIRAGKEAIAVEGPLTAMKLRAPGSPKVTLNGKGTAASAAGGFIELK